jgi:hypothetical protein
MSLQKSFLSPLGYQLAIQKIPNTILNVVSVNLPGITVEDAELQTPFKVIRYPDKVVYNDFVVRFKVDENMANYREIFEWMHQIGRPEQFSAVNANALYPNDLYSTYASDGTLLILNSANKPNIEVRFRDLFPVVLGDLEFTSTDTDVNYIDATVTFRCLLFTIHTV